MHAADHPEECATGHSETRRSFSAGPLLPDSSCYPACPAKPALASGASQPGEPALAFSVAPPAPPAAAFGDYEIVIAEHDGLPWELGRGAMGITYRAFDTTLHCPVALKVLAADLAGQPEARARLLREARAAAGLRHPHIAGVHRFGVCPDGHCFYAMELVEGETLEARVLRDGPLPAAFCLDLVEQVASALLAAEKHGIVHRDLKPANLMLQDGHGEPGKPWVKVIDFGLAKAVLHPGRNRSIDLTRGDFLGTPGFASPEQFDASAPLDTRSDIFSLGVTLWWALTGNLAFIGESLAEIHARQLAGEIPWHQLSEAGTPAPLVGFLGELLQPDLTRRPQTARALSERLRLCREQLAAPPVPAAPPPRRWLGAGRIALALAFCGTLAFAVAGRHFPSAHASLPSTPLETVKSVAVLPFENLSVDRENAFLAEGIQNDLIINLGRVAGLKVISRGSVNTYQSQPSGKNDLRSTAAALGVAYLLEGSVQRAEHRVRVSVQLIEARHGETLWSKAYDRELADLFAIQDELAECISDELRIRLSPAERAAIHLAPTSDLDAYDLDLRARQLLNAYANNFQSHQMMPEAIRLLDSAVARDAAFLRGWCDLSAAHMALYWYGYDRTPARLDRAADALKVAVRLNPDAGETHLALAEYHYHGFRNYERARTELALARRTLPNDSVIPFLTGSIDRRQGRWRESERNYRRALELDPRNTDIHLELATNMRCERRYADQEQILQTALAITPGSYDLRQIEARVSLDARADSERLRTTVWTILRQDPANGGEVAECALECALCDGDIAAGREALAFVPAAGIPVHGVSFPQTWFAGLVEHFLGDETHAREAFLAARAEIEQIALARPDFARAQSVLGLIDAFLGHPAEAVLEGRRGVDLLTVAQDSLEGPELLLNLATIEAVAGKPDEAIEQLEAVARMPSRLSYGLLRLHPQWAALRGKPRFEALLRRLAAEQEKRKAE